MSWQKSVPKMFKGCTGKLSLIDFVLFSNKDLHSTAVLKYKDFLEMAFELRFLNSVTSSQKIFLSNLKMI